MAQDGQGMCVSMLLFRIRIAYTLAFIYIFGMSLGDLQEIDRTRIEFAFLIITLSQSSSVLNRYPSILNALKIDNSIMLICVL